MYLVIMIFPVISYYSYIPMVAGVVIVPMSLLMGLGFSKLLWKVGEEKHGFFALMFDLSLYLCLIMTGSTIQYGSHIYAEIAVFGFFFVIFFGTIVHYNRYRMEEKSKSLEKIHEYDIDRPKSLVKEEVNRLENRNILHPFHYDNSNHIIGIWVIGLSSIVSYWSQEILMLGGITGISLYTIQRWFAKDTTLIDYFLKSVINSDFNLASKEEASIHLNTDKSHITQSEDLTSEELKEYAGYKAVIANPFVESGWESGIISLLYESSTDEFHIMFENDKRLIPIKEYPFVYIDTTNFRGVEKIE